MFPSEKGIREWKGCPVSEHKLEVRKEHANVPAVAPRHVCASSKRRTKKDLTGRTKDQVKWVGRRFSLSGGSRKR